MLILSLSSDSYPVGRVDKLTVSDETLMELLIDGLDNKNSFLDSNGDLKDFRTWDGVTLTFEGEIETIGWGHARLLNLLILDDTDDEDRDSLEYGGSIDLTYIPLSVKRFRVSERQLEGEIDTASLPSGMRFLYLESNRFFGSFVTAGLPHGVITVNISRNQLSGTLDLTKLPKVTRHLLASRNTFSGTLDLSSLPATLENLSLRKNNFTGALNFLSLPEKMKSLDVKRNHFNLRQELHIPAEIRNLQKLSLDDEAVSLIRNTEGDFIDIHNGTPTIRGAPETTL